MNVIETAWEEFFRDVVQEATDDEKRWLQATFYAGAITVLNSFFAVEHSRDDTAGKAAMIAHLLTSMRDEIGLFREQAAARIEITEFGRAAEELKGDLFKLGADGIPIPATREEQERELMRLRQAAQEGRIVLSERAQADLEQRGITIDQLFSMILGDRKH